MQQPTRESRSCHGLPAHVQLVGLSSESNLEGVAQNVVEPGFSPGTYSIGVCFGSDYCECSTHGRGGGCHVEDLNTIDMLCTLKHSSSRHGSEFQGAPLVDSPRAAPRVRFALAALDHAGFGPGHPCHYWPYYTEYICAPEIFSL